MKQQGPPFSRCRHHRHPQCHQHPTDHPHLPLRRRCSSGEFPRHLCTTCSHLGSITTAALSPWLPCLVLLPPPPRTTVYTLTRTPPRAHAPHPLPLPQTMHWWQSPRCPLTPMCSHCFVSHILRWPGWHKGSSCEGSYDEPSRSVDGFGNHRLRCRSSLPARFTNNSCATARRTSST